MYIKSAIPDRDFITKHCVYPDFPIKGVRFIDIFPCIERYPLRAQLRGIKFEGIVLLPEARGFIFYDALACIPNVAVVPLRKKDKMPGPKISIKIHKEYGDDILELQVDALIRAVDKLENIFGKYIPVIVFDDVVACGGTMLGIAESVQSLEVFDSRGDKVHLYIKKAVAYLEIESLKGREFLENHGLNLESVIKY